MPTTVEQCTHLERLDINLWKLTTEDPDIEYEVETNKLMRVVADMPSLMEIMPGDTLDLKQMYKDLGYEELHSYPYRLVDVNGNTIHVRI